MGNNLLVIIPIFLIVIAGYGMRALGIVKSSWIKVLNGFVYYVSLPALIIASFANIEWGGSDVRKAGLYSLGIILLSSLLFLLIIRLLPLSPKDRSATFIASIVPNSVYLGIPLVDRILDTQISTHAQEINVFVSVIMLVGGMLAALIGIEFVFLKTKNAQEVFRKLGHNPLIISVIVGITLSLVSLPDWLTSIYEGGVRMVAQTASPVALFVLGSFLYGKHLTHKKWLISLVVVLKLALMPILALSFARFIDSDISNQNLIILSLMTGMPTAVTAFILSEAYDLDKTFTAATMLITTILSVISIPLIAIMIT